MAKITVLLDKPLLGATSQAVLMEKLKELLSKAEADLDRHGGVSVNLNITADLLDAKGKPVLSGQQFVQVIGKVLEVREFSLTYSVGERRLHNKKIPLSLVENGDSIAPGAENICVRKWFAKKEGLTGAVAGAL